MFIAPSAARGTTLGTAGVNFVVDDASLGGVETASGTVYTSLSSNARMENGFYKIPEGETKTFTLMVVFDPDYESFYTVRLHSFNWNTVAAAPLTQQDALPAENFETAALSIRN